MARTYTGFDASRIPRLKVDTPEIDYVTIKLIGGMNVFDSPQDIANEQMPRMLNARWKQNGLKKIKGYKKSGSDYAATLAHVESLRSLKYGYDYHAVFTWKDLYVQKTGTSTKINFASGGPFVGDTMIPERWATLLFDEKYYFVGLFNPLRVWDGVLANPHDEVPMADIALGIMPVNNHIVLVGVGGFNTIMWSQNYSGTVSFTGTGSGMADLVDSPGNIVGCVPIAPLVGLIFKTDSMGELRATGEVDLPFEFIERARIGTYLQRCIVAHQMNVFFVGNDEQVYLYDGSQFQEIGQDIKDDLFATMQQKNDMRQACAVFDTREREYRIMVHDSQDLYASQGYAYNIDKKRWRRFNLDYLAHMSMSDLDIDTGLRTRPYLLVAACPSTDGDGVGRVLREQESEEVVGVPSQRYLTNYDGMELGFSIETKDFSSDQPDQEMTLGSVKVGYKIEELEDPGSTTIPSNAGERLGFDLVIEISTDSGNTFPHSQSIRCGDRPYVLPGAMVFAIADFEVSCVQFRARIRNSQPGKQINIYSIGFAVSQMKVARKETTR